LFFGHLDLWSFDRMSFSDQSGSWGIVWFFVVSRGRQDLGRFSGEKLYAGTRDVL